MDDRQRAEALLELMRRQIESNLLVAQEVRELRQAIQKLAGGNMLAGLLKTLGVRASGR